MREGSKLAVATRKMFNRIMNTRGTGWRVTLENKARKRRRRERASIYIPSKAVRKAKGGGFMSLIRKARERTANAIKKVGK
jgi:hypothetical protein